jgi:putative membrane protein
LPTDVSEDQKETYNELAKLSGAEFDKEYVKVMVDDHEKDVDAFQEQADDGDDADTKAFAAKTLPTLKSHLEMIKKIDDKVN